MIEFRCAGASFGTAIPQVIGRHLHPKARPETEPAPVPAIGIGYIRLVDAAHDRELGRRINYAALAARHDEHDGAATLSWWD